MLSDFRVLERDVTGVFITHDCDFVEEGYLKTIQSIRPERVFVPAAGTPAAAKNEGEYRKCLHTTSQKIVSLSVSVINDLWSSVSLNVPSDTHFEGSKVPLQICQDLPRIQCLVLNGTNIYSNRPPPPKPVEKILYSLKPLTRSNDSLYRLATLLTQSSLDNIFLIINDTFTNQDLGFNITHHVFSTFYITSKPLKIRICRLFKLISTQEGETIGYVKGERVYILEGADLSSGIAKTSKAYDCISPFFTSLADAIAFSWIEKPTICLVS